MTNNNCAASPNQQPPVRRVGVFTMGVCLIFTGITILLALFHVPIDLVLALRLCPLFLVLLGGEMLYHCVRSRGERLRLDFFSAVLCFFLIGGSLAFSAAVPLLQMFGPQYHRSTAQVENEVYDQYYQVLNQTPCVTGLRVYAQLLPNDDFSYPSHLQELKPVDTFSLHFTLENTDYTSAGQFAQDCYKIMGQIPTGENNLDCVSFHSSGPYASFSLSLDDRFAMKAAQKDMERMVEMTLCDPPAPPLTSQQNT